MKKITLVLLIPALLVMVIIWGRIAWSGVEREYIAKYFSLKTINAVIESNIDIRSYKVSITEGEFILIEYPIISFWWDFPWNFPSGPPAAVFNSNGDLVDTTFDAGDDPDFQDKWNIRDEVKFNLKK